MAITFITGIDTGVGKTVITGLLAAYLFKKGQQVITAKLAQTGNELLSEDIELHRRIMGIPLQKCDIEGRSCPYVFSYAASPHLAARLECKKIDIHHIDQCITSLSSTYENVLLEGVGGLMVPLFDSYTTFDYLRERKYPVVVVSTPKLGSINHTLLTMHALTGAEIPIRGIIYNYAVPEKAEISRDSMQTLKKFYPGVPIMEVPSIKPGDWPDLDFSEIF